MAEYIAEDLYDECGSLVGVQDNGELIRCKDCKHAKAYYHGEHSSLGMFTYYCIRGIYPVKGNEYCSKAERKEE